MSSQKPNNRTNKSAKPRTGGYSKADKSKGMGLLRQPIFFSAKWKYLLLFSVSLLSFLYFYYSYFYDDNLLLGINGFQSKIAAFLLNIFGDGAVVASGNQLIGPKGAITVVKGCDGIEPVVMYVLAVLIVPLSFKKKIPGLMLGIICLFLLNIMRIAGLYLSSIYFPGAFDFLHVHGGYIIFIGLTVMLWLLWLNWALRPAPGTVKGRQ